VLLVQQFESNYDRIKISLPASEESWNIGFESNYDRIKITISSLHWIQPTLFESNYDRIKMALMTWKTG
jgi:hypothetical protein